MKYQTKKGAAYNIFRIALLVIFALGLVYFFININEPVLTSIGRQYYFNAEELKVFIRNTYITGYNDCAEDIEDNSYGQMSDKDFKDRFWHRYGEIIDSALIESGRN